MNTNNISGKTEKRIKPFSGYKGRLYEMLNGVPTPFLTELTNKVIAEDLKITIEEAKKKRTVTYKQSSIVINKIIGDAEL